MFCNDRYATGKKGLGREAINGGFVTIATGGKINLLLLIITCR